MGGAGSAGAEGLCDGCGGGDEVAGGELDENLAEILENHELRRWGGVTEDPCFSIELDRESGRLLSTKLFGGVAGIEWPFAEPLGEPAEAGGSDLGDAPGICRGSAGAAVLE